MKLNKILSVLFGGALLFGGYACTDEVKYTPAGDVKGNQVYFSADDPLEVAIPLDATSVSIDLYRIKVEDELEVSLTSQVKDTDGNPVEGVLTVPAKVTFPAGANKVEIPVAVQFSSVVPEKEYLVDITIDGQDTTPYGEATREFVFSYAPWSDWEPYSKSELGQYTLNAMWSASYEDTVYVRKSLTNPDLEQYMMYDPFTNRDQEDYLFQIIINLNKKNKATVDGEECYLITIDPINTTVVNTNYNEVMWLADAYTYFKDFYKGGGQFKDDEQIYATMEKNNLGPSYYNPNSGLFTIDVIPFISLGNFEPADEYLQLPGFKSYTIAFNQKGNFVDPTGAEYAVISAYKSDDVASYSYALEAGELEGDALKDACDKLAEDTEAELVYETSTNLTFQIEENGTYTVVAVGFNEAGERVCNVGYSFNFETVKAESKWTKRGLVEYTDGFINSAYSLAGGTWEVEIEESKETAGVYRLVNPYKSWPENVNRDNVWSLPGNYYMTLDCTNPEAVVIPVAPVGLLLSSQDGEISMGCLGYFLAASGQATMEQLVQAGYFGTIENQVLTFPAGCLFISWANSGGAYANIDPENPTLESSKPNFFWGKGTFAVDFQYMDKAPARKKVSAVAAVASAGSVEQSSKAIIKGAKALVAKKAAKPTNEQILNARLSRIYNFK